MQSFKERSGFHGNQHCYQQEPHELSRLENYRHHHSQSRQVYEAQSLPAVAMPAPAPGSKDCYGQQAYPGYGNSSTQAKKQYKGGKVPGQHLPGNYSNRVGTAYPGQYVGEGHVQQKWEESSHMTQYKQDMGRMETSAAAGGAGPQYLEQNVQAISQSQCSLATQPSAPVYTSQQHQQSLPQNSSPSPYAQGHLHYPQHTQSLLSSTSPYMEKCSSVPHCYKGYAMPPSSQYSRQVANNNSLKQSAYRSQNSYGYQQPPARAGYEQQGPLQGISNTQDNLSKYQHFSQQQQNFCLSEMSVRSPEQYYQNCSPSSSQSPARSVGRSPSYNSTPSPLMINSETFQYNQTSMPAGVSSSATLQDQGLLMTSTSVKHPAASYTGSMKERFSEKLLSNPSLWSLNALTSQVENISNNVQQLLLSEALVANKKASKRTAQKKVEDFKGQLQAPEDISSMDAQGGTPVPEPFGAPQPVHPEMRDGGYVSSSEDQLERSYYCCGQNRSPAQAYSNSQATRDIVSTCAVTSPEDLSVKSSDTLVGLQNRQVRDNQNCGTWLLKTEEQDNLSPKEPRDNSPELPEQKEKSSVNTHTPRGSPNTSLDESTWTDRLNLEKVVMHETQPKDSVNKNNVPKPTDKEHFPKDAGCPDDDNRQLFFQTSPDLLNQTECTENRLYPGINNRSDPGKQQQCENSRNSLNVSYKEGTDEKLTKPEDYASELPINNTPGKTMALFWRDDLVQDQYLTSEVDSSEPQCFNSRSEILEERLPNFEKDRTLESPKQQSSILSHQSSEVQKGKDSLPLSEEVINNKSLSQELEELCSATKEHGYNPRFNMEITVPDTVLGRAEMRSVTCDSVPSMHTSQTVLPVPNEKATPASKAWGVDHRDAEVLEPESPQLPGKSILPPAPSWANTPPSPKKGDEDIEPGISCPSAVTPSIKADPVAPSAHLRVYNRKHGRGRRSHSGRQMQTGVRIRRHLTIVETALHNVTIPSCNSEMFPDQTCTVSSGITPEHFLDSFPSRMCTRSVTAMATPKASPHVKRQPGPKAIEISDTQQEREDIADQSTDPLGFINPIKLERQRPSMQTTTGNDNSRSSLTEGTQQESGQDAVPLSPVLTTDQKSMVLRSRKFTHEKHLKEKKKDKQAICLPLKKLKENKKQKIGLCTSEVGLTAKPNLVGPEQKAHRGFTGKSEEKDSSKRKSNFHSPGPLKKQRGIKVNNPEAEQSALKNTLTASKGPKKGPKRGEHFKMSARVCLAKEDTLIVNTDETQSTVPQLPAKTKYLPPRKGRGLKYEAMVQKITSPGSKKYLSMLHVENVTMDQVAKTTPEDLEAKQTTPVAGMKTEEDESMFGIGATLETPLKRKNCETCEERVEPTAPTDTSSLIINTPRLAKQRAIKNNHEMHLKQRRKKRKGNYPLVSTGSTEQSETPPAPAPSACKEELTDNTEAVTDPSTCRRGKRKVAPVNQSQEKAAGRQSSKYQRTIVKDGSKRRGRKVFKSDNALESKLSTNKRRAVQSSLKAEEKQQDGSLGYAAYKAKKNESRHSFSPYVRIVSSENLASLCTIVNRPDEESPFLQVRKSSAKTKHSVAVGKATPDSSIMTQGPLVNKNLADRCLTCCLCGKPTNYRELGDLCGPYYPEDSIPRKALSVRCMAETAEDREKIGCVALHTSPLKKEGVGRGRHPGRPGKAAKVSGESITVRPSFKERFRKLQQSLDRRAGEGRLGLRWARDSSATSLRRLQLQAEAKEHWAHEACAVWTDGIILVAGKLYGLKEAMHAASQTHCSACQETGASVACSWNGCPNKYHYICAKEMGCLLQDDTFKIKCTKHKCL